MFLRDDSLGRDTPEYNRLLIELGGYISSPNAYEGESFMEGGPVGRLHPFVFEMLELFLQKEKSMENMKKIVVLLLGLFGWMQIASAQLFDKDTMEEVNSRLGLGMVAGALGIYDSTPCGTVGMNILFKGAYFDFTYFAPRHSEDVRVGQWSDKQSWSIHFEYQIPITEKIRVIPLVGYAQVDLGRTNGWDWHVSKKWNS